MCVTVLRLQRLVDEHLAIGFEDPRQLDRHAHDGERRLRVEPVHVSGDVAINRAGTDLAAACQRVGNLLQERIAGLDSKRLGGCHDGIEFGIGEADWLGDRRHGRQTPL
jgi:hypothetical protein